MALSANFAILDINAIPRWFRGLETSDRGKSELI